METRTFKRAEINALEDLIRVKGKPPVVFTPEETEQSGKDFLEACSENDKAERAHRAAVMKDASRIVIF
jgi:hypothetical protein